MKETKKVFQNSIRTIPLIMAIVIGTSGLNVRAAGMKDLNNDGVIDKVDFDLAINYYNSSNILADINGDSIVDIYDMVQISAGINGIYSDNDYYAIGSKHGNLLNSSYAVVKDDIVYFRNTQDNNKLYKSKLNREGKVKLSDDEVTSINIIGNRLYYSNKSDNGSIYSINTDGTNKLKVVSDSSGDFVVSSGYIFYKSTVDGKLSRTDYNGNGKVVLSNDAIDKFVAKGEYVYYINVGDNRKLYRIKNNGTERTLIISDSILNYDTYKNKIYYINTSDSNKIYAAGMNGENKIKVLDEGVLNLNVWNDSIYYSSSYDGRLYKVNLDGTGKTNIQQETLSQDVQNNKMSIGGDWIFYNNAEDSNRLYAIDVNGNSKRDMDTVIEGRVNIAATSSLSLRADSCVTSPLLHSLRAGEKVEIISQVYHPKHLTDRWEPETWYKINYMKNGQVITGYVGASYILLVNDNRQKNWLGVLSGKYESNGDPGKISNTAGDRGGKSYGVFQFASATGSLDTFIYWLADRNENFYKMLRDAKAADGNTFGSNFDATWTRLAREHEAEFLSLQLESIRENYYDKAAEKIKRDFNVDINAKSFAFRNVVWSTAVQHGVYGATRVPDALNPKAGVLTAVGYNRTEREFIDLVYKERAKFSIYFSSYDPNDPEDKKILDGLTTRYLGESSDALKMYDYALQQQ